jgi:hypothetical protein
VNAAHAQANFCELRCLVFHERDQRRDHQRSSAARDGGQLIAERLPCTGRHHQQQIAPGSGRAANLFLIGAEGGKAEYGLEEPAQRVRIGKIGQELAARRRELFPLLSIFAERQLPRGSTTADCSLE